MAGYTLETRYWQWTTSVWTDACRKSESVAISTVYINDRSLYRFNLNDKIGVHRPSHYNYWMDLFSMLIIIVYMCAHTHKCKCTVHTHTHRAARVLRSTGKVVNLTVAKHYGLSHLIGQPSPRYGRKSDCE